MRVAVIAVLGTLGGLCVGLVGHRATLAPFDEHDASLCLHLDEPWVDQQGRPWFVIPMCSEIVVCRESEIAT